MKHHPWWQRAVFYQIYPRSFADSNGDGIGDLDGITAHLDYLNDGTERSLGIDAIWLNPIYPSPLRDFGYDVADYCGIHSDFGDMAGFERLVKEAHRRGIRVIVDFVPNHTSDQHPWFIESRSSRTNPKRDWYLWVPGTPGQPPNNWLSTFGGRSWEYDAAAQSWYMHSFLREQPDLNYRNADLVRAMHEVLRFWLDRGVDGFRVDVVSYLMKDARLRDNPVRRDSDPLTRGDPAGAQVHIYDRELAENHDIIRGFRRVLEEYDERMMVGELWARERRELAAYLRPDEIQLAFNFRFFFCPWEADAFRRAIEDTESLLGAEAWPTYTLSNHDFPRHISRYPDGDATEARARAAAVMLLTLRGTPFLYYGEEIGMRDVDIPFASARDPVGRDRCRTPMQWSATKNGGFSTSDKPWLPAGDCSAANVARQIDDSRSMLSFYRRLIRLRKATPALIDGTLRLLSSAPQDCLAFVREHEGTSVVVCINFSGEERRIEIPRAKLLLSSDASRDTISGTGLTLSPNEAIVAAVIR